MTLYINTVSHNQIILSLAKGEKTLAYQKINAPRQQAEKLLPAIDKLITSIGKKIESLKKIVVADEGGSFTSLRIGILTANALAYALKIPVVGESGLKTQKKLTDFTLVAPIYSAPPNIGQIKKVKI